MLINRLLFAVGTVLSCGWVFFYGLSTLEIIVAALKNEHYYMDVVRFYLLPYAIAPFFAISYIEGTKRNSSGSVLLTNQWITFIFLPVLLCCNYLKVFLSSLLFTPHLQSLNSGSNGFGSCCHLRFLYFFFC